MSQAGVKVTASSLGAVTTLTGNAGGAVGPSGAGNINVVGGNNITITGNPGTNTLTASVTGTTNHAVQVGNATGSLTSLTVGTNGQVLIGATGANPAFATITSTDSSITFTPGANSLNMAVAGKFSDSFVSDAGTATPVLGVLNIVGGSNITTSAAGNTVTITSTASSLLTYTNVAVTPYVVTPTDQFLSVNCSASAITVQLPNAPSTGRVFYIKDRTGSSNIAGRNITVTTVGGAVNIDGAVTYVMNTQYAAVSIIFNGSGYEIY
jgi:hypothetical protein